MFIKNRLKEAPLVRWAWRRTPTWVRNRVGGWASELSTDDRPPAYRLSGQSPVRLRPAGREDVSAFTAYLSKAWFVLHIGEGAESIHHVDTWLQFLTAVDPHTTVVFRSRPLFDRVVRERAGINAIYIRNARQTEWLVNHMPGLAAVFYDANTGSNVHFIRFFHPRHVFLGHGDSEKSASCGKQFRSFDEVWTAGQAHIDRFANTGVDFSSLRFRIVGRPQTRALVNNDAGKEYNRFLYLPTWEAYFEEQNYSSIHLLGDFLAPVSRLVAKTAVVKFHPGTGKRNRELIDIETQLRKEQAATHNDHLHLSIADRAQPAIGLMADAAFLISDISSVVSDFLVTGRPIFLYGPQDKSIHTSSSAASFDSYCYVFSNAEQLLTLVDRVMVQGVDRLRESRLRTRDYFVSTEATLNRTFETELKKLASGTSDPATAIRLLT